MVCSTEVSHVLHGLKYHKCYLGWSRLSLQQSHIFYFLITLRGYLAELVVDHNLIATWYLLQINISGLEPCSALCHGKFSFLLIFHGKCCNLAIATKSILLSSLMLAFGGWTSLILPYRNIFQTCSLTFRACFLSLRSSWQAWKVREHVWHKVLFRSNPERLIYNKVLLPASVVVKMISRLALKGGGKLVLVIV